MGIDLLPFGGDVLVNRNSLAPTAANAKRIGLAWTRLAAAESERLRDLQHWYCTASRYSEGRRSSGLMTSRSRSVTTLQCDCSRAGAPAP